MMPASQTAYELMLKCIKSCDKIEQLWITLEWIDWGLTKERYPDEAYSKLLEWRGELFHQVDEQKKVIYGIPQSAPSDDHF